MEIKDWRDKSKNEPEPESDYGITYTDNVKRNLRIIGSGIVVVAMNLAVTASLYFYDLRVYNSFLWFLFILISLDVLVWLAGYYYLRSKDEVEENGSENLQ